MITISEVAADASLLRPYVNQQLAAAVVKNEGYDWPEERILRIANDAAESIAEGIPASWAFVRAFDLELCMYGDGSINNPIGILNIR